MRRFEEISYKKDMCRFDDIAYRKDELLILLFTLTRTLRIGERLAGALLE